uniref:Uncharacterized protein n=1 Tax=Octopus bimaculoides TaxID=37653 RepID=A0A0L8HHS2_OCTBM
MKNLNRISPTKGRSQNIKKYKTHTNYKSKKLNIFPTHIHPYHLKIFYMLKLVSYFDASFSILKQCL